MEQFNKNAVAHMVGVIGMVALIIAILLLFVLI
jgi:hypothetical protein